MNTKELTVGSMIIAIIAIMTFIPQLGFIQIAGVANVTLIHIPVLITAFVFKNSKLPFIAGTTFGVCSMLNAFLRPTSITSVLFQNPLISVLPRVLFALFAFYLFHLLNKKLSTKLSAVITAFIATLLHTTVVVFLLYTFGQNIFSGSFITVLLGIVATNGIFELIIAGVLAPAVAIPLQKHLGLSKVY